MQLIIVTPAKEFTRIECHMVTFQSLEGEMGVIHGHSNMIVGVESGDLIIQKDEKEISHKIQVSSGFAEISEEKIVFLVEKAEIL